MDAIELANACNIHPDIANSVIESINMAIDQAELNTPERLAGFLANCCVESDEFKFMEENLNYKAESLCRVWPNHFDPINAQEYAHHPEAIANRAYANRMGNGPEESGDGWKYRGRGWLQTTGKNAYKELSQATGIDFVSDPDSVATPEGSAVSAVYFWNKHGLNDHAGDIKTQCRIINGGYNGLEKRESYYQNALAVLGG